MKPHPASCCCEPCLQEIEAQLDGSQPYYVKHLIAGLRESQARERGWQRIVEAMARKEVA